MYMEKEFPSCKKPSTSRLGKRRKKTGADISARLVKPAEVEQTRVYPMMTFFPRACHSAYDELSFAIGSKYENAALATPV